MRSLSYALILAVCCAVADTGAAELGRLFFTPEQRLQLEYQQASADGSGHAYILVNGVVQKHGGERTIWINGSRQQAGRSDERTPSTVPVAVPGKIQPVPVKVGQKLLLDRPAQETAP